LIVLNQQLNKASWHRNSSKCVLLVIDAGVGKHSLDGAVLRPFTRELLQKRGTPSKKKLDIISPVFLAF
jgi:hypothetical protein